MNKKKQIHWSWAHRDVIVSRESISMLAFRIGNRSDKAVGVLIWQFSAELCSDRWKFRMQSATPTHQKLNIVMVALIVQFQVNYFQTAINGSNSIGSFGGFVEEAANIISSWLLVLLGPAIIVL